MADFRSQRFETHRVPCLYEVRLICHADRLRGILDEFGVVSDPNVGIRMMLLPCGGTGDSPRGKGTG
jgi:hypothetical protein